jgi:hypothetical protein
MPLGAEDIRIDMDQLIPEIKMDAGAESAEECTAPGPKPRHDSWPKSCFIIFGYRADDFPSSCFLCVKSQKYLI